MISRGLLGSILVLLGGLVVSALPASTPLLRQAALVQARDSHAGRTAGYVALLVGLGLLTHAWHRLCRQVTETPEDPESLALVRFATVVWSAPLLLAPPLFSRDGWSYAAQSAMTSAGISPYDHGPAVLDGPIVQAVDPIWMHTATPYGPLPLWYGATVAEHTGNPWMLVIAHRVLALVGVALLAWAVPRLAAWGRVNPARASAVVLASPVMLANGVGGLHNDLLMAGLMAAALVAAAERGWWLGAVLGACAAAVKVPGGLVCVGVALVSLAPHARWQGRVRRLGGVGSVAAVTLLALGVLAGTGAGWIDALSVPTAVRTPLSVTTQVGGALDGVAAGLGLGTGPTTFLDLVRQVGSVTALGVAGWLALRWPTGDRAGGVRAVALVLGVTVLLAPAVHVWYALWPLPFVASLALTRVASAVLMSAAAALGLTAPLGDGPAAVVLGLLAVLAPVAFLLAPASSGVGRIPDPDESAQPGGQPLR